MSFKRSNLYKDPYANSFSLTSPIVPAHNHPFSLSSSNSVTNLNALNFSSVSIDHVNGLYDTYNNNFENHLQEIESYKERIVVLENQLLYEQGKNIKLSSAINYILQNNGNIPSSLSSLTNGTDTNASHKHSSSHSNKPISELSTLCSHTEKFNHLNYLDDIDDFDHFILNKSKKETRTQNKTENKVDNISDSKISDTNHNNVNTSDSESLTSTIHLSLSTENDLDSNHTAANTNHNQEYLNSHSISTVTSSNYSPSITSSTSFTSSTTLNSNSNSFSISNFNFNFNSNSNHKNSPNSNLNPNSNSNVYANTNKHKNTKNLTIITTNDIKNKQNNFNKHLQNNKSFPTKIDNINNTNNINNLNNNNSINHHDLITYYQNSNNDIKKKYNEKISDFNDLKISNKNLIHKISDLNSSLKKIKLAYIKLVSIWENSSNILSTITNNTNTNTDNNNNNNNSKNPIANNIEINSFFNKFNSLLQDLNNLLGYNFKNNNYLSFIQNISSNSPFNNNPRIGNKKKDEDSDDVIDKILSIYKSHLNFKFSSKVFNEAESKYKRIYEDPTRSFMKINNSPQINKIDDLRLYELIAVLEIYNGFSQKIRQKDEQIIHSFSMKKYNDFGLIYLKEKEETLSERVIKSLENKNVKKTTSAINIKSLLQWPRISLSTDDNAIVDDHHIIDQNTNYSTREKSKKRLQNIDSYTLTK
ncbi:uncharacterized protein ASCRUDRAFT_77802 [Ascoidea rubescens DSM 1968]|uniref:Uncharacterized protein n=1 Tax=Ascoidea rubescens DSM 1968 TaxID=1344418 RepID=A0A1D2VA63_9ASCO|nr:hypothetical protein ASCRUDRAFT_77802 [Ascoidea rubescens DSM 1968]ODV58550.1 hypothetical protein ASCRUDRAFT_77802 [Ascoidea rubescens DSM 1968]